MVVEVHGVVGWNKNWTIKFRALSAWREQDRGGPGHHPHGGDKYWVAMPENKKPILVTTCPRTSSEKRPCMDTYH